MTRWRQVFVPLLAFLAIAMLTALLPRRSIAAGLTVMTHGFELGSSYPGWISEMADQIPNYSTFPGTNFTTYRMTFSYNNGYYVSLARTNGIAPSVTDSGEILVELDWSQISGDAFDSYASTYNVAGAVAWVLEQTNILGELNGHAMVELPIHLVGHSRGGSLMSEVSRLLGTNGIWVDHLTTLDPYPLNNDGNTDFPATVTDAPVHTYSTVLFADNYWQDLGIGYLFGDPDGEAVSGAYVRQLSNLSNGYGNDHSNVHLWYHATVELSTPASDGSASVGSAERQAWWVPSEVKGALAGFYYSLIGGGDRLSNAQPLGPGHSRIRDGYNQWWDFGAGTAANRTAVAENSGSWPSLIRFNRLDTNAVAQGQSLGVEFFYQWPMTNAGNAVVSFYLDDDFNPFNSNGRFITQLAVPGTGADSVYYATPNLTLYASNAAPGWHSLCAQITAGAQTRFLYAPELVYVGSGQPPPVLNFAGLNPTQFLATVNGVPGQTVVLQVSTNLRAWRSVATNVLAGSRWTYTNTTAVPVPSQYFRAVVAP